MRLIRHATASWAEAMRTHKLAPPDDGFANRLQKLSEAAAAEQLAWQQAHDAGMAWRPVPGAASAEPPYELRPGTGRRGPEDLWLLFDNAVMRMNLAIAGSDSLEVSHAFGAISETAAELARAVSDEDAITREARELARPRQHAA